MIVKQFYKYAALSNDFILLDWSALTLTQIQQQLADDNWSAIIQKLCHRKLGIGADGVLVVYQQNGMVHARIFNQDGSDGHFCGNGARAIAHFMHQQYHYPNEFLLMMGEKPVHCEVNKEVSTAIGLGKYLGETNITLQNTWPSHRMDVGNPHLIIFAPMTADWLKAHGKQLECYFGENHKTNVEFVWEVAPQHYQMEIFERGVGYSEACGSGAMAVTQLLFELGKLKEHEVITISMPGGRANTSIKHQKIYLSADVELTYHGNLN